MSTDNPYASPNAERATPIEIPHLEPPQSVSFQPTFEDLLEVFEHITRGHAAWRQYFRRRQNVMFAVAAGMAGVSGVIALTQSIWDPICGLIAFGAVAVGVIALRLPDLLMRRHREQYQASLSQLNESYLDFELTTTLTTDGFQASDKRGHWFRTWEYVPMVEIRENMLLVYFEGSSAYGIPVRAFFNQAAFEGYAELAKRLWSAAHVEPVSESGEVSV